MHGYAIAERVQQIRAARMGAPSRSRTKNGGTTMLKKVVYVLRDRDVGRARGRPHASTLSFASSRRV
jgi:hypothetical protein